ncbi:spore germination protein [Metabacillus iocasae]|uniref:Spore germination protein n=1 Tax=Priestia iocasae TaxID=2291674 RepID=A0ABS2QX48_9BACI|nr:spore germination protein [Metabacillus iocasae]MBM7703838.1 hypothetical protein [Metabacillus iocasae]
MPVFIKSVCIKNVTGGIVNFGDIFCICPKTTEKTITGSGSSNSTPIDALSASIEAMNSEE